MIAIDPGGSKKGCAGARFTPDGDLVCVAADVRDFAERDGGEDVVIERPQQDGRSRAVPPKVLIELAWNGALLAGRLAGPFGKVIEFLPSEWKESLPKAVHHSRLVEALAFQEHAVLNDAFPAYRDQIEAACRKGALSRWAKDGNAHYPRGSALPDVLDAVGLGLFALKRIDKKGNPKW
jgi:hypothetical protein